MHERIRFYNFLVFILKLDVHEVKQDKFHESSSKTQMNTNDEDNKSSTNEIISK
jgi:hypothetical protein